ncbi:MAG: hypothetical protein LBE95_03525 [Holosporaceae bacterium]|nr:hypothetical protein [Holosporaceae bacterium]
MDKDIHREGKIPAPSTEIDDLLDRRLKLPDQKENSVLLLLPMSGNNECIGRNILNACLLAVNNAQSIDFYVVDAAARDKCAIHNRLRNKKLRAIIGPVFYHETTQYGALFPNVPILSFSNNLQINSDHVFACGLSLQDEIRALFAYAKSRQINSFLAMLPDGEWGNQILEVVKHELETYGLEEGDDLEIIRYASISRKAATKYAKNSNKKAVFVVSPILNMSKLEDMQVFTLSSMALSNREVWEGAIFAFADNQEQREFVEKYYSVFGTRPSTLDMIAYDLVNVVKESVTSGNPIVQTSYRGCLGEFSLDKKKGLTRKLSVFQLQDSKKIELSADQED